MRELPAFLKAPPVSLGWLARHGTRRKASERLLMHLGGPAAVRLAEAYLAVLQAQTDAANWLLTSTSPLPEAELPPRVRAAYRPGLAPTTATEEGVRAVLLVENELWPELLRAAYPHTPVFVLNARLEEALVPILRAQVAAASAAYDALLYLARQDDDAVHLMQAGIAAERVLVMGDAALEAFTPQPSAPQRHLLVWKSHEADERAALDAWAHLRADDPSWRLTLAPADPRRVPALAACAAKGVSVASVLRDPAPLFASAALTLVGGAFSDEGGHNVCEPVLAECPVVIGPHHEAWRGWVMAYEQAGVLSIVQEAADIARLAALVVDQAEALRPLRRLAQARARQQTGALRRQLEPVFAALEPNSP